MWASAGVSRRQRREAGQLSEGLARVAESLADARADLATKIDEVSAAQHSGQSDQASGMRELSDLLEGQIARLAELGEQWRAALLTPGENRGQQTEMLAEHFDTQRRLIEGYSDEIHRLGGALETQIGRLGDLGDAWVTSATSAESYQDRQVQVMGDYAEALKSMAIEIANIEVAIRERAADTPPASTAAAATGVPPAPRPDAEGRSAEPPGAAPLA